MNASIISNGRADCYSCSSDTKINNRSSNSNSPSISSNSASGGITVWEVQKLKEELAVAKSQIARMDLEISQNKITKHTLDQALSSPSQSDTFVNGKLAEELLKDSAGNFTGNCRPASDRSDVWSTEERRSDTSESTGNAAGSHTQTPWNNTSKSIWPSTVGGQTQHIQRPVPTRSWGSFDPQIWNADGRAHLETQPALGAQQNSQELFRQRSDVFGRPLGGVANSVVENKFAHNYGFGRAPNQAARPDSGYGVAGKYQGWPQYPNKNFSDGINPSPPPTPNSFHPINGYMSSSRPSIGNVARPAKSNDFGCDAVTSPPWNMQVK